MEDGTWEDIFNRADEILKQYRELQMQGMLTPQNLLARCPDLKTERGAALWIENREQWDNTVSEVKD